MRRDKPHGVGARMKPHGVGAGSRTVLDAARANDGVLEEGCAGPYREQQTQKMSRRAHSDQASAVRTLQLLDLQFAVAVLVNLGKQRVRLGLRRDTHQNKQGCDARTKHPPREPHNFTSEPLRSSHLRLRRTGRKRDAPPPAHAAHCIHSNEHDARMGTHGEGAEVGEGAQGLGGGRRGTGHRQELRRRGTAHTQSSDRDGPKQRKEEWGLVANTRASQLLKAALVLLSPC